LKGFDRYEGPGSALTRRTRQSARLFYYPSLPTADANVEFVEIQTFFLYAFYSNVNHRSEASSKYACSIATRDKAYGGASVDSILECFPGQHNTAVDFRPSVCAAATLWGRMAWYWRVAWCLCFSDRDEEA